MHYLYLWLGINIIEIHIRHTPIRIPHHHMQRITQSVFYTFGGYKIDSLYLIWVVARLDGFVSDHTVRVIQQNHDKWKFLVIFFPLIGHE